VLSFIVITCRLGCIMFLVSVFCLLGDLWSRVCRVVHLLLAVMVSIVSAMRYAWWCLVLVCSPAVVGLRFSRVSPCCAAVWWSCMCVILLPPLCGLAAAFPSPGCRSSRSCVSLSHCCSSSGGLGLRLRQPRRRR
jgi:hypothetical protein